MAGRTCAFQRRKLSLVNFLETVGPSAMGVEKEDDAMGEASRLFGRMALITM